MLVKKDDDLIEERKMEQLENTVEKEGLDTNANGKVEEDDDLMEEKKDGAIGKDCGGEKRTGDQCF